MIRKITEKEYNEAPGVRRSALFNMAKSPAHYKWSVDNPAKETPALAFGRALHCCVLEPAVFESTYAVAPSVSKATKAGERRGRFLKRTPPERKSSRKRIFTSAWLFAIAS